MQANDRLGSRCWADVKRGAALGVVGCGVWAAVEYVATLFGARVSVGLGTALQFAVLDLALVAAAGLVLAPLVGVTCAGARLLYAAASPERARRWPGLLGDEPLPPAAAAWLWALVIAAVLYAGASATLTYLFTTRFKAPVVVALALALAQLGLIAVSAAFALVAARGLGWLGRKLGSLGGYNPLARMSAAFAGMVALAVGAVVALFRAMPAIVPIFPTRHLLASVAFGAGLLLGAHLRARRGTLLPRGGRARHLALGACAGGTVGLLALGLLVVGAHHDPKSLALTASPPLSSVIDALRAANDFDGDGYGTLLGENDCAPLDRAINPEARDIPDNGIDENCNGSDFSLTAWRASHRAGERLDVPEAYRRPWNVLLITVDTLRYDHTGFGGHERNTTPNLDKLVRRSISFEFANAPSAGTMASIPAIQTSKFFHSGIALSGERRPKPPKVLDDNLLLAEIIKRAGHRTGAILSHEYFTDWGLEQGFDSYDNELGAKRDPFRITSHTITDKAVAWIAKHAHQPWFLWLHYIDPHGRYVAHPGETQFGDTEEDLYDGEIAYTDKHLGRLFEELWRMPGGDRTIIVITSDHGDGFNEHGEINHGYTLYREVLHVPLIVYIPDIEPRSVPGAVSPLDIVPTVADLLQIDVSELSFEGDSLVPQLFYGRDAHDRVVFAETNAPSPQRTAITSSHKLIYKMKQNLYELYDLAQDPWEQTNVWGKDAEASRTMKAHLDAWLERVFYARDAHTNQAQAKRQWHLLAQPPTPAHPIDGLSFDRGAVRVLGWELSQAEIRPGDKIEVIVYLKVEKPPTRDYRLAALAWQGEGRPARGPATVTADGLLPASSWRPGEYVRDRLSLRIPSNWTGDALALGMAMSAGASRAEVSGPTHPTDPHTAKLGDAPLAARQPAPTPPPQR